MKNNLLILKGDGKSTLLNFFLDGKNPFIIDDKKFKDTGFYLSNFLDKEYVIICDCKKINWDLIKRMISGDPMIVNIPYREMMNVNFNYLKFIVVVDKGFNFDELDGGIKRRAKMFTLSII